MMQENSNFVRHIYKVNKELKSYTVYEFVEVISSNSLLTEFVRIEPFLNYSNAKNFNDYFRIKNRSSWAKSNTITGLKPTSKEGLFFGDCSKPNLIGNSKKSLLLFYLDTSTNRLIIDVYKDYYPFNNHLLESIIKGFKLN